MDVTLAERIGKRRDALSDRIFNHRLAAHDFFARLRLRQPRKVRMRIRMGPHFKATAAVTVAVTAAVAVSQLGNLCSRHIVGLVMREVAKPLDYLWILRHQPAGDE